MKTFFAFSIFCFLLLFANLNYARKEPGDYWKSIMKDQPMPEAIKGLLHQDAAAAMNSEKKMEQFVKDFDSRHSLIIYHSNPEYKEEDKPNVNDLIKDQKQQKSDKKN
ncbi:hypothetical protein DITRI_Ditri01bG0021000 [Diplodiscus trichospermus]